MNISGATNNNIRNVLNREYCCSVGYHILGHGNNGSEYIQVPNGSLVVAKAHPGDDMTLYVKDKTEQYRKVFDLENLEIILRPSLHKKSLYKLFGSVSIFKGGDLIPNFQYDLIDLQKRDGGKHSISYSGIIKIPLNTSIDYYAGVYTFEDSMTVGDFYIKESKSNFTIGSFFRFCDNNILKLDTVDHDKEKILTDELQFYEYMLINIDDYIESIIKNNENDVLILIGTRKSNTAGGIIRRNKPKYKLIEDELKKAIKSRLNSQNKSYIKFHINTDRPISMDNYIQEFKNSIPTKISTLESAIQLLRSVSIEEYINNFITNYGNSYTLLRCIRELKEKFTITQSTIFENSEEPSVTYNFVCRTNDESQEEYNNNFKQNRHIITNNQRNYRTRNNRLINNKVKNTSRRKGHIALPNSVRNQISESVLQRKSQIRNSQSLLYAKN